MVKRRMWKSVALASMAMVAFAGSQVPAHASVDGFPILYASKDDSARTCVIAASDGEYQGIVCVDLITYLDSSGDNVARGRVEVYCQNPGDPGVPVRCNGIVGQGLAATGAGGRYPVNVVACNLTGCPDVRYEFVSDYLYYSPFTAGCDDQPDSSFDEWMTVQADSIQITLPNASSPVTGPSQTVSTGHYYICH